MTGGVPQRSTTLAEGALIVIRQATETEDYTIVGCDNGVGTLDIVERSVENARDWNDEKKIRHKEMKFSIPAAGWFYGVTSGKLLQAIKPPGAKRPRADCPHKRHLLQYRRQR